jgi:hypothetical protein
MRSRAREVLIAAATLGRHVRRVVGVRPDEQMTGVDASSVVASMADTQASRNSPIGELIGEAMRVSLAATTNVDQAISTRRSSTDPWPAIKQAATLDLLLETLDEWATFGHARCPLSSQAHRWAATIPWATEYQARPQTRSPSLWTRTSHRLRYRYVLCGVTVIE